MPKVSFRMGQPPVSRYSAYRPARRARIIGQVRRGQLTTTPSRWPGRGRYAVTLVPGRTQALPPRGDPGGASSTKRWSASSCRSWVAQAARSGAPTRVRSHGGAAMRWSDAVLEGAEQGGPAWVAVGADVAHAVADVAEGELRLGVGEAEARP